MSSKYALILLLPGLLVGCSSSDSGAPSTGSPVSDSGADSSSVSPGNPDATTGSPDGDAATETGLPTMKGTVCIMADTVGKISTDSFVGMAWAGAQAAVTKYGWQATLTQPATEDDAAYHTAMNQLVDKGCDLVVGVGFLLATATNELAQKYPSQKFLLLDYSLEPLLTNVLCSVYFTNEPSFLAGYVAAGVSKTGKVATFGGKKIPTVTDFMDGFALGVAYYNTQNNPTTPVQVLGYNYQTMDGIFTNDFADEAKGKVAAEELIAAGADIILPVAGQVGYGAAGAIKQASTSSSPKYIIGVDSDWGTMPDYADIVLTSVLKFLDKSVLSAVTEVVNGTFIGEVQRSDLKSGEVGIAGFGKLDGVVPEKIKTDLDTIKKGIVDGTISTVPKR